MRAGRVLGSAFVRGMLCLVLLTATSFAMAPATYSASEVAADRGAAFGARTVSVLNGASSLRYLVEIKAKGKGENGKDIIETIRFDPPIAVAAASEVTVELSTITGQDPELTEAVWTAKL